MQNEWTSLRFSTQGDRVLGELYFPEHNIWTASALCCQFLRLWWCRGTGFRALGVEPSIIPNWPSLGVLALMVSNHLRALFPISRMPQPAHPSLDSYGGTILVMHVFNATRLGTHRCRVAVRFITRCSCSARRPLARGKTEPSEYLLWLLLLYTVVEVPPACDVFILPFFLFYCIN